MNTIQLQSVGRVPAKPASEFKSGEQMMWNFGAKTTVTGIHSETKAFITYNFSDNNGTHTRKLKKTRLVAIG